MQIPEWQWSIILLLLVLAAAFGGEHSGSKDMCKQWAGPNAIIYDTKCIVPEKDGTLRPAARDAKAWSDSKK